METRGGRVHHAYGRCAPYIRNSRTIHAVPMHHHPRFCCSLGAAYAAWITEQPSSCFFSERYSGFSQPCAAWITPSWTWLRGIIPALPAPRSFPVWLKAAHPRTSGSSHRQPKKQSPGCASAERAGLRLL